MSATDRFLWRAGDPWRQVNGNYPECGIDFAGDFRRAPWMNKVVVYGRDEAEAKAIATKIAAFLNADEEVRHDCD